MGDALVNASSNEPTFTTRLHADASLGTTSDPRGAAEGRRMRSGTNVVRKIENRALRAGALVLFALRRAWLTVRYGRRLQLGPGIVFKGRLVLGRGVRVSIGANCRIGKRVLITGRGQVTIGNDTLLNGCWIGSDQKVDIGSFCLISDCDIVDTDFHNLPPRLRHEPTVAQAVAPVHIGHNVWVGARSIVLKGVTIGDHSVVGAGTVVREDIAPRVVVAGNPATVVKQFRDDE
jgi:acetyltransferase-like isoleucine patch superfamily enzyme